MADGGIGEAALLGAAMGGGSSMLTGRDPLQGALLGGLLGGAGGALFPGAESAGGVGAGSTETTAANIMSNQPALAATQQALTNQGLLQSGLDLGGVGASPATMAASAPAAAAKTGIAALMPQTLGGKIALGTAGLGLTSILADRNKFGVPTTEHYNGPLRKFDYDPARYEPYT